MRGQCKGFHIDIGFILTVKDNNLKVVHGPSTQVMHLDREAGERQVIWKRVDIFATSPYNSGSFGPSPKTLAQIFATETLVTEDLPQFSGNLLHEFADRRLRLNRKSERQNIGGQPRTLRMRAPVRAVKGIPRTIFVLPVI